MEQAPRPKRQVANPFELGDLHRDGARDPFVYTIHVMEEAPPHARTVGAELDARGEHQRLPVSRRLDANVQCWGVWLNLKRSLTL
jgi:hypothetical protein